MEFKIEVDQNQLIRDQAVKEVFVDTGFVTDTKTRTERGGIVNEYYITCRDAQEFFDLCIEVGRMIKARTW